MEHLPIVIFEIVLCVFLAFAVLAKILIEQIIKQREKIIELYMMINSMKNQDYFLCKNRIPADPQYVDEWFRFKKMF